MIASILKQITFILLILFLGINFLKLLRLKAGLAEKLSSGFMLGIGFSTFGLFLLGFVGYKFNFQNILFFLIGVNVLLTLLNLMLKNKYSLDIFSVVGFFKKLDLLEKVLVGGIVFFLLTSLIRNLYWPIWMWDAVQMYDYRAKLIVESQSIFFPAQSYYDILYPLLTSLLHSILYVAGSTNPQYVYTLVFFALIMGVYAFVRKYSSRKFAIVASFAVSSFPLVYQHSIQPLTNLTHSTFLVLGVFYLIIWLSKDKSKDFFVATLLFSFARFTRNEPVWMAVFAFMIIYLLIKRKLLKDKSILYLLVFFAINYIVGFVIIKYNQWYRLTPNKFFTDQFGFVEQFVLSSGNINLSWLLDPLVMIFRYVIWEVFILILFTIMIFLKHRRIVLKSEVFLLSTFLLWYLFILFFGSIFYRLISTDIEFKALSGSLERFSIVWQVLVFVLFFLVLYGFLGEKKYGKKV